MKTAMFGLGWVSTVAPVSLLQTATRHRGSSDPMRLHLANRPMLTGRNVVIHEPEKGLEGLTGANLTHLTEMLPDYVDRLVGSETMIAAT